MDLVALFGENHYLGEGEQSGDDGMVTEQQIVEVDLASLVFADEVAVAVVDGVEGEAGQVHGNEIEIHAFYTEMDVCLPLALEVFVDLAVERERPSKEIDPSDDLYEQILPILHHNKILLLL